jgi:hypothetical protein
MKKAYSKKELIGMKYAGCWLEPKTHEALRELAELKGKSMAKLLAEKIENFINERKTQ